MNNKMITIPYADAIEYGENTSALFKALWELTDLIRLESRSLTFCVMPVGMPPHFLNRFQISTV